MNAQKEVRATRERRQSLSLSESAPPLKEISMVLVRAEDRGMCKARHSRADIPRMVKTIRMYVGTSNRPRRKLPPCVGTP